MASPNSSMEHGILLRQWSWPFRMAFWWSVIGVLSWAGTVGAHWAWANQERPDDPIAYERAVLEREAQALTALAPVWFEPRELAAAVGNGIRDTALVSAVRFARTLMNWPAAFRQLAEKAAPVAGGAAKSPPPPRVDAGRQFVGEQLLAAGETWDALLTGTYIFAVRTAMYAAAAPLLALLVLVGTADGLVARAQRKAAAGRESASIYHRAKLGASFVAILGFMVCLLVPSMAQPAGMLVPLAAVIAALLRVQTAYYKKYL